MVGCPVEIDLSTPEYLQNVLGRARELRVPLSGHFDITYRCNFRCAHCYAGHAVAELESRAAELTTGQVTDLLSAAADAGCFFVIFSGGEPLVRKDFAEIYVAARSLGLLVWVFSNASLIDESHVELFREYPPRMVEVSVYGATEETYRRVTGTSGALAKVRTGIEHLLAGGVRLCMKSMILRENAGEIADIERMAKEYGVGYRADPVVIPRLDFSLEPRDQRVKAGRAVEIETSLEGRRAKLLEYLKLERADSFPPSSKPGVLYQCGAGVAGFQIDPQGFMRPCFASRQMAYNAVELGFAECWRAVRTAVEGATWAGRAGCLDCADRFLCGYCPALFELEGATPERPPSYICDLGRGRRRALQAVEMEALGD